jgi:hypothetical protein
MSKKPLWVLALLVCLVATLASGQTITGTITGTVSDASGSVVPNVKVTATNTSTNVTSSTTTNAAGLYNLLFLPVGDYTITTEGQGFKKSVLGPFKLEVNQIARVDVSLQVGAVTETVEVRDIAPILQTESTATGETLSSTKLTSIPLNGRNFAALTALIPGATITNTASMNTSGRFQGGGSRPYVNGNREQTNNFLLDGIDINDSIDNRIGYQPNVDALEEVKVITGNSAAEWGNVGGALVAANIKSGTNQYHGNVFEFLRNNVLDANGFFPNRGGAQRRAFRRNIFGGTFGGPIKRDKLFFFMDYEGTLQRDSGPAFASVAPQAWRNGDLSQFLGQNQFVRDPLATGNCNAADRTACFAGNILPASRITNPVARTLFGNQAFYPLPNTNGIGPLGITNNFLGRSANTLNNHQADLKFDYRATDKDNISARWSIGRYEQFGSAAALPVFLTSGTTGPTQFYVVNWSRTWTNRLVSDSRVGFSRVGIDDIAVDWSGQLGADGNQKFGIPGGQPIPGLSSVALGSGLSGIGSGAAISSTVDNKYQYFSNWTYQVGKHLVKFGGSAIRFQQNRYYAGNNGALGSFTYNGTYTSVAYADFLLNQLASKGRGAVTGKWGHRHWRNSLFVQDDFKVTPTFTLNLGMRWEFMSPIYEVADRQVNVDINTGQVRFAGRDGNSRALYEPYYRQFMPRVGFAWTPGMFKNKMVVRAGYAFTSFLEGTGANLRLPLNPPFFIESDIQYDPRTPGDIRTGFTDVIARGDFTGPRTGAAPFFQVRAWDPNLRPQFTSQINVALEYQLTSTTSITTAYVGQKGTHLVAPREGNQPLPGTGPFATWINQNDRRPLARVLPNVSNIPFTTSAATMDYHSLQVSGRRRMSGGLELVASYSLQKTLTDNLGYYGSGGTAGEGAYWQNAYDRRGNRGRSFFDARNVFSLGGLYELPFGKGKKLGSDMPKALDFVFGGWSINYLVMARSGFPVTIFTGNNQTGQGVRGNIRPNRYRNLNITNQSIDAWFGPGLRFCGTSNGVAVDDGQCAYGQPSNGSFGNSGIASEEAPGFFNMDASIGKRFKVSEKNYFDFRVEFFNMPNSVAFNPPGGRDIAVPGTFGLISSQANQPRNIQFGLKYHF